MGTSDTISSDSGHAYALCEQVCPVFTVRHQIKDFKRSGGYAVASENISHLVDREENLDLM
jgi:hypothetical protein